MSSYVFILCPPYSGSTLLWELISTSRAVSSLPDEGQFIPEVKEMMRQKPWNPAVTMPWEKIKNIWEKYWDPNKPLKVEKSPPNIIRAHEIEEHFSPAYFVIMVRNPYAHCEGLMRRNNSSPREAAEFIVYCLRRQALNARKLENCLVLTYEELTDHPASVSQKIQSFLPELGALDYNKNFKINSIDGNIERKIINLNKRKIDNLSMNDLNEINQVLMENEDIMAYWGYEYYIPSR